MSCKSYNIFHEKPSSGKNLLLLPVGVLYNRDIQKAKEGDKIYFLGGSSGIIVKKCYLDLHKHSTSVLCDYIYGRPLPFVFRKWEINAVIDGNGARTVSRNKCLMIWYIDE